jgi:hypothetical protein
MINNLALVKKVLDYIYQNEEVILDELIMNCNWGFHRLADEGYIEIRKSDNKYVATVTLKGLKILFGQT